MARYLVNVGELAEALGLDPPAPGTVVELDLEPVDAAPYALARSEPLRAPLEELVGRGLSNRAIAMELNDRCLFGPQGGLWHSSSIKRLRSRLGV